MALGTDDDSLYEPVLSPWEKEFDELKKQMVKLPDCEIYKKIVKEGYGAIEIPEKARITIHYNAYWEKETLAFDSTYMRGDPKVFNTGQKEILEGLELAVKTMREGEESQFIISPELLFGDMGCPPRIKPKATGLFIVHLIRFTETGDANAIEQVNTEDRRKFSVMIPKIREVHVRASDLFKQGHTSNACKMFHRALNSLECCQLSNDAEQKEQQALILRLYTNLAVCYNKMNLPKKTCLMCNEIRRISDISKNCKALFQEGRALMKIGDYNRSRQRLIEAQRLEPANSAIVQELKALDSVKNRYEQTEKNIWKRAFNDGCKEDEGNNAKPTEKNANDTFYETIIPLLDDFQKDEKSTHIPLPNGLSNDEISYVRELTNEMSLKLQIDEDHKNQIHYKVVKPK